MPFYTKFASEALASHIAILGLDLVLGNEGEGAQMHSYPPPVRSLRSERSDLTSSASYGSSVLRDVGLRGPDCFPGSRDNVGIRMLFKLVEPLTNLVRSVPFVICCHVATTRSAGLHTPKFTF